MSLRNSLYRVARLLGDVNAVQRGKVPQRMVRRATYRSTYRLLRRLTR